MVYLPINNLNSYACYVVQDKDTIRAYVSQPRVNANVQYTDFYINSHYLSRSGTQNFTQYTTIPDCMQVSNVTNDVYYRNDLAEILIIFMVLFFVIIFLPYKLMRRIFGRWLSI